MFGIEDLKKQVVIPQTQYLQSKATHDVQTQINGSEKNMCTYFFPFMVFPRRVELLSATLLYKNDSGNVKTISIAIQDKNVGDLIDEKPPLMLKKFNVEHGPGKLLTTQTFDPPLIVERHQPFYFYCSEKLENSGLTIAYRNLLN